MVGRGPRSTPVSLTAGPMVRIRLPPAKSHANHRFLGVWCAGVYDASERPGRRPGRPACRKIRPSQKCRPGISDSGSVKSLCARPRLVLYWKDKIESALKAQNGRTGRKTDMENVSRRSVLRSSLGVAAAGALARPYIANAAATTATVWWTQGFAQEEDISIKKIFADYEKASGNTLDYSIVPYAPMRQKIISAMTTGEVPDLFQNNPGEIIALFTWDDKLVDLSDIVDTQREEYTDTALLSAYCYNNVTKRRSYYGVPYNQNVFTNHIWRPLVEKAGYKIEDIPKTWDAYYDFFKDVQKKLREQSVRNVYGLGFQVTTNGVDPNFVFHQFLIAYGGQNVVTKDGKSHVDDPRVKEAAIKAMTYPATAYKEGFVPPGAINWNDADDNNAFHAKQIVMDLDGTISTEVAVLSQGKKEDYDDIVTMGLALSNDGKPVPSQA